MGGTLAVRSTKGEGSVFTFTVSVPRAAPVAAPAAAPPAPAAARRLRVLVAEDNPVNCLVVQRMLARSGHDVTVVGTGVAAIEQTLTGRFDVVLMDVQMPEMNGIEATRTIRARETGWRVPIVGLTAHAFRGDRERCLEAGMDEFLAKPVRRAELDRTLAAIQVSLDDSGDARKRA
jgi:CheY-like chemotaxis protein